MANEFSEHGSHSAEYFGDTRDYWWNPDFLQLLARRWGLHDVRQVLDVGCGVGHWGQLLGRVLPSDAQVTGIDRDPLWVQNASKRASERGLSGRFRYQVAVAEQLPFEDGTFDLVTCQTVLIHAASPAAMISEMVRVTRPGGLVAVAEPNNMASALIFDSLAFHAPVDDILALVRFQLLCERGKAALGEGNNSVGQLIPELFAAHGLADLQVYLNDKASTLVAPYSSPEQRAAAEEISEFSQRDFWIWSRADTQRYFLAGGGCEEEFEAYWARAIAGNKRAAEAIARGTYSSAGGSVGYLISGRKPGGR
jgi:SAM-dependent methyltransferase